MTNVLKVIISKASLVELINAARNTCKGEKFNNSCLNILTNVTHDRALQPKTDAEFITSLSHTGNSENHHATAQESQNYKVKSNSHIVSVTCIQSLG